MNVRSTERDDLGLLDEAWSIPPPPVRRRRSWRWVVSAAAVIGYTLIAGAICGTALDVWPFSIDGPPQRDLAESFLWPVGEPIERTVALVRAAAAILTSSDAAAVIIAWPFAAFLCALVALVHSVVAVVGLNLVFTVVRRMLVRRK
jgi:hypothetical protein